MEEQPMEVLAVKAKDLKSKNKIVFVAIAIAVIVLLLSVVLVIIFMNPKGDISENEPEINKIYEVETTTSPSTVEMSSSVMWQFDGTAWKPLGDAPECENPLILNTPVELNEVTGILYPGQTRGGNYKPHGGFRFDGIEDNEVTVTMPDDALVIRGARYIAEGDLQYTFDFVTSCGIMHRMGHFLELSPKFQAIAEQFPEAVEGDSRTTWINPPVSVKEGDVIATKVGITQDSNTFFDWGVFDLRSKNEASMDPAWASSHSAELDFYAVCWLDLLSSEESVLVKSLPAGDPTSGKKSDFCK